MKNSKLSTEKSTSQQLYNTADDKKTDCDEAIVTDNVAYNIEISPDYLANHAHTCHINADKCDVNYKAMDDDLVITDNAIYNMGL